MSRQTNPWQFHAPTDAQKAAMQTLRDLHEQLAIKLRELTPVSREQSLALTKLEESAFWSNKAANQRED